ncbi:MAG: glutathione peroxidase [Pseudomonadota bacterium]|jgi:glutathione peroxidase
MTFKVALLAIAGLLAVHGESTAATAAPLPSAPACSAYLNQDFRKLHSSQSVNLCTAFAGKPLLIINTASHCGYTPQFKGLEAVYQKYKDRGLVVVGFASDDFAQEAKDEAEAADTCFLNYGVTFTMLAPQPVKGAKANVVFKELARQTQAPSWNFNKYLVRPNGTVQQHFGSAVTPTDPAFDAAIQELLK